MVVLRNHHPLSSIDKDRAVVQLVAQDAMYGCSLERDCRAACNNYRLIVQPMAYQCRITSQDDLFAA